MNFLDENKIIIINIKDPKYPKKLKEIDKPPKELYCIGNTDLLNNKSIAIVGTRHCSEYGAKIAHEFSKVLSEYELVIVSGMAIGIDAIAHKGALLNNGKTIAVLPSGLEEMYPPSNRSLAKMILNNDGLIITEYKNEEKKSQKYFIERNRIVSGLAIGTLVVEGGIRSGSSITARLTYESNKPLFCIPSNIDSYRSITPNSWIKKGAFLVTSPEDIINKFTELGFELKRKKPEKIKQINLRDNKNNLNEKDEVDKSKEKIPKEYKEVYRVLEKNPKHINEIAKELNANIQDVTYQLFMLEMGGNIIALPGSYYKKKGWDNEIT